MKDCNLTLYFVPGDMYERYFGVPYATPPLGDLRFTKSIPPSPWQDVLETISFSKGCVETDNSTETSEDCLYLNVFVPGRLRYLNIYMLSPLIHKYSYYYSISKTKQLPYIIFLRITESNYVPEVLYFVGMYVK